MAGVSQLQGLLGAIGALAMAVAFLALSPKTVAVSLGAFLGLCLCAAGVVGQFGAQPPAGATAGASARPPAAAGAPASVPPKAQAPAGLAGQAGAQPLDGSAPAECPPGSRTICRRGAVVARFKLPEDCLAPAYDWAYAADSGGKTYQRGGAPFLPPFGFDKLGLSNVRFEDKTFMDAHSGWHVAYHGTDPEDVAAIVKEGLKAKGGKLKPKHGNVYGDGIYCSPEPRVARKYAGEKRIDEKNTDVLLMARVRPGAYKVVAKDIWLVTDEDAIRCHSILFFRG